MKNILIISTGGTVASIPSEAGLAPNLPAIKIMDYVPQLHRVCNIYEENILNLDSSNIQPEEWKLIAKEVRDMLPKYDGIVILHGTDTMAYTASMLSFILGGLRKPIILTGSQLPIINRDTDAVRNVFDAVLVAMQELSGVYVVFDRKIIRGCRAVKVRTLSHNAFESINFPFVGEIKGGKVKMNKASLSVPYLLRCFDDHFDPNVFLLKLIPGTRPELLDCLQQIGYRGIVVEAFGLGGVHQIRRNLVEKLQSLSASGIAVVVTTQCLYETSDLTVYEIGREILKYEDIITAMDMTSESTVAKLMWVLGHTTSIPEVKKMMLTNLCGEITIPRQIPLKPYVEHSSQK